MKSFFRIGMFLLCSVSFWCLAQTFTKPKAAAKVSKEDCAQAAGDCLTKSAQTRSVLADNDKQLIAHLRDCIDGNQDDLIGTLTLAQRQAYQERVNRVSHALDELRDAAQECIKFSDQLKVDKKKNKNPHAHE